MRKEPTPLQTFNLGVARYIEQLTGEKPTRVEVHAVRNSILEHIAKGLSEGSNLALVRSDGNGVPQEIRELSLSPIGAPPKSILILNDLFGIKR